MSSLKGKVVLVTEADQPTGHSIALQCAQEGARLALCSENHERLKGLEEACVAENAEAIKVTGSLNDGSCLEGLIKQTTAHYGQLDVLVPIVGPVYHGTVETVTTTKLTQVLQRNITNIVHLCQLATPHLEKTKGSIVIINGLGAIKSFPNLMPYCVAGAGLNMFVRCTAVDLGKKGIRVNSVCPGLVDDGKSNSCADGEFSRNLEFRPHRPDMVIPLGGPAAPTDVANMAVFLASQDASFMTGTALPVDGGVGNIYPR